MLFLTLSLWTKLGISLKQSFLFRSFLSSPGAFVPLSYVCTSNMESCLVVTSLSNREFISPEGFIFSTLIHSTAMKTISNGDYTF